MEYRIVVCGDGGCGKSALTIKFVQSYFIETYDPTIEDNYRKQVMVDGEMLQLDILDTAGQEEYSAMRDQYIRKGQGFILVYSITSRKTFTIIDEFRKIIIGIKDGELAPMILVGNKLDLELYRSVSKDEALGYAKKHNMAHFETSALTGINVDEIFFELVRRIKRSVPSKKKNTKCSIM